MASEWAKGRAVEIVGPPERFAEPGRSLVLGSLAAALDEARAEGLAEGLTKGAERERWECHRAATVNILSSSPSVWNEAARVIADRIAARGPMRGPEEGE